MVSFKEATKPVKPVKMNDNQNTLFLKAQKLFESKKYSQAETAFSELSTNFDGSPEGCSSSSAMISNAFKMQARANKEKSIHERDILSNALENTNKALKCNPYWAEYLESRSKVATYLHQNYGCDVSTNGETWSTSCYKISKALGLFGISPGMTMDLECSICGRDPMDCEHVPGKTYEGKVALKVAKNIVFEELSIVDEPMQLETYIQPEPLTKEKLKQILPEKLFNEVAEGKKTLTCKDLIEAIRKNRLHGIGWSK
ncbi:hypothetical protein MUP01_04605 [Candidatus Bathyarchaeota archaeon]|nr:hypothetical protein [Candidatus Bathyarchaeota archaeon]